ncbi:hypothetical protein ACWDX6_23895 [Streptomyces sp. NPDC003027]
MADIKVGDRVEVTKDRDYDHELVGRPGVVTQIDTDSIPYLLSFTDDEGGEGWVMEVRRIDAPSDGRERHVTRAKELLADTMHTGDDIIRMARFLAGE